MIQAIVKIVAFSIIPTVVTSTHQARGVSIWKGPRLQTRGPPQLAPYTCGVFPVTPATWKQLQIDDYLLNYPDGKTSVNLAVFARQNNVTNLDCNLSAICSAGQLCYPITGRAWWVLAAVEQLTLYENEVFSAIGFAADKAKTISTSLIGDLVEHTHERKANLFQAIGMALTLAVAVVAIIAAVVFVFVPGTQAFAVVATAGAVAAIAQVTALMKSHHEEEAAGKQDAFIQWAGMNDEIGQWQQKSTEAIAKHLKTIIESPISTEAGLYGVLKNGEYCRNNQNLDENDLKLKMARILAIRLVGHFLRRKKAFITYGSDPCNKNTPSGAFPLDDGWLSYCDNKGVMMNVIYDDNGKSGNHIYGAKALVEKYQISAKYITKQAYNCHKLHNDPDYDPYADGTNLTLDENAPCLINLPVCDLTDPAVHKKKKKKNTVKACLAVGGVRLP